MGEIIFHQGGGELLAQIEPLWRKLNEHHLDRSQHFNSYFAQHSFDVRCRDLNKKARGGELRVFLAEDSTLTSTIGYLVAIVGSEGFGSLDSLFVETEHRGSGIGRRLFELGLEWLEAKQVKRIRLSVAEGNEAVMKLYEQYGFRTRLTVMERKELKPGNA